MQEEIRVQQKSYNEDLNSELEELAIKIRKLESNLTNQERTLIIMKKEIDNILAKLQKH